MSLLTRSVMLLAIVVLSISLGQGLAQMLSPEPSPLDELVATRNLRRAIAYRFVDLRGGRVAASATAANAFDVTQTAPAEGNPGAEVSPNQSLTAVELNEINIATDALQSRQDLLENGDDTASDDLERMSLDELRTAISGFQKSRKQQMAAFAKLENDVIVASQVLAAQQSQVRSSLATLLAIDYETYLALIEQEALRAEMASVRIDIARTIEQTAVLEEQNYLAHRQFERVVDQIARYETVDPTIRSRSARVAKPWLRGLVTTVDADPRVGEALISIGSQDGVENGQTFSVHRNGQFIGHVRVENLERNRAVVRLTESFRGRTRLQANDRIVGVANLGQFEE